MLRGVLFSVIGAALGGVLWTVIAYFTGYEIGFVAWAVGAAAGIGMAVGAKDDTDVTTGVLAAVFAVVSILTAKYATVRIVMDKMVEQAITTHTMTDEDVQVYIADQIVDERTASGRTIAWPDGIGSKEEALELAHYPKDIADDASGRWKGMSPEDQQAYKASVRAHQEHEMRNFASGVGATEIYSEMFGIFDILWMILAIASAWKIGSGSGEDD
jgi:phosphate/sulfate permease